MSEQLLSGAGPTPEPAFVCPWCSAALPTADEERCPSCGAALHEAAASEVPGVTRVDHEALLRSRSPVPKPRGLIGWLSGEYQAEPPDIPPGTLEPPDAEVKREMLRLELAALEAEVLARQAEAVGQAAAEAGRPVADLLEPAAEAATAAPSAELPDAGSDTPDTVADPGEDLAVAAAGGDAPGERADVADEARTRTEDAQAG